jgi:phosphoribosylformylglycinamidine synthase
VRDAVREGSLSCAHDVSDGGVACALAEVAIAGAVGVEADVDALVEARGCSGETALFGEGPGGFVVGGDPAALERLAETGIDVFLLGSAGGSRIAISAAEAELDVPLDAAERAWRSLGGRVESPAFA